MKKNIDFIIFALKQLKAAENFGFTRNEANRNLKLALNHYWQAKELGIHIFRKHKLKKTKGEIFLLLKSTDNNGFEVGDPRLYAVEYDPLLLEKILEIRRVEKKGKPVAVKLTNLNLKINDDERLPDELGDLDKYNSLSGDIDIELEEILLPTLPKKN